ncbi:hypothetical protein BJ508DRAFT_310110 [Ascobolus immersus RN42]|uniref:Uncharacterized protein n=1 Tax=Ascobolus immersus RN42 TaxID=1160509 RepID=A0A3N4HWG2_ASCIM|nr:hypothetical protein BJ508DRAFT_310110 [Ascobolus immersus RN42]
MSLQTYFQKLSMKSKAFLTTHLGGQESGGPRGSPTTATSCTKDHHDSSCSSEEFNVYAVDRPAYRMIPRIPAGDAFNLQYWDQNRSIYQRFLLDYYLVHSRLWNPKTESRLHFISNKENIQKICWNLRCTREEYMENFELNKSTSSQQYCANFAPVDILAGFVLTIPKTDFYLRVWKATFHFDIAHYLTLSGHLLRLIRPFGFVRIKGYEKVNGVQYLHTEAPNTLTDLTWPDEYITMTWDSIEKYEQELAQGLYIIDSEADLEATIHF